MEGKIMSNHNKNYLKRKSQLQDTMDYILIGDVNFPITGH
jgi:hypothetical protein